MVCDRKILGWVVGMEASLLYSNSSYSFSPGRRPMYLISMSVFGLKPESSIILLAKSTILTGSPMSKMKW